MEDETLDKIVQDISKNHRKIIDDWCKAYLSQLYQEGFDIKPGNFTLIEELGFHEQDGIMGKRYWFRPKRESEK